MKNTNSLTKVAIENEDGTFSIEGTEHQNLSPEDFRRLHALQDGTWIVFRNYGSKPERGVKTVDFNLAK